MSGYPVQRRSKYGGDDEYWVQVRETGTRELAEEREERITQTTQDRSFKFLNTSMQCTLPPGIRVCLYSELGKVDPVTGLGPKVDVWPDLVLLDPYMHPYTHIYVTVNDAFW